MAARVYRITVDGAPIAPAPRAARAPRGVDLELLQGLADAWAVSGLMLIFIVALLWITP